MFADPDSSFRSAAFAELRRLTAIHGEVLEATHLAAGFAFGGARHFFLTRAKGIFKPAAMSGALSIKTTVPRAGRVARYDDHEDARSGEFVYRLQGDDPSSADNRLIARAHESQAPLIYFVGVAPGRYRPLWPVFVTRWFPEDLSCRVQVDELGFGRMPASPPPMAADRPRAAVPPATAIRREYVTTVAKRRLHQAMFRERVLEAYADRCAVCNFPRRELLDGAHIVPDSDPRGVAETRNGLALCRLHHAVFDHQLLGIRPDGVVELSEDLLATRDGPTFEAALKPFHGRRIGVPRSKQERPDRELLAIRYNELFKAA